MTNKDLRYRDILRAFQRLKIILRSYIDEGYSHECYSQYQDLLKKASPSLFTEDFPVLFQEINFFEVYNTQYTLQITSLTIRPAKVLHRQNICLRSPKANKFSQNVKSTFTEATKQRQGSCGGYESRQCFEPLNGNDYEILFDFSVKSKFGGSKHCLFS